MVGRKSGSGSLIAVMFKGMVNRSGITRRCPLAGRICVRRELGLDGRGRTEGLRVKGVEILSHRPRSILRINRGSVPFILTAGALLLDVGADQAGIDSKALAAD